jgi:hypothetical protein
MGHQKISSDDAEPLVPGPAKGLTGTAPGRPLRDVAGTAFTETPWAWSGSRQRPLVGEQTRDLQPVASRADGQVPEGRVDQQERHVAEEIARSARRHLPRWCSRTQRTMEAS